MYFNGTTFDKYTWYQLTESRVGTSSGIQNCGIQPCSAAWSNSLNGYWQILPLKNDSHPVQTYRLSLYNPGFRQALGVCYNATEQSPGKTQVCFSAIDPADAAQSWTIEHWPDEDMYQIQNVANGTNWNLDCHKGNPLFMNSDTALFPNKPAQHWIFQTLTAISSATVATEVVNVATATAGQIFTDPLYTSVAASTSSSSSTATQSTNASMVPSASKTQSLQGAASSVAAASSSLSTGAKVGIGVGVTFGVIVLAVLVAILTLYHRRHSRPPKYAEAAGSQPTPGAPDTGVGNALASHDLYNKRAEVPDQQVFEKDGTQYAELPAQRFSQMDASRA